MPTISEIRQQYPQYSDMSDGQLADALHSKFYSDMPKADFDSKIGLQVAPSEKGFFDRVGDDADKRIQMMNDIKSATNRGEQSKFEGQLQLLGKGGAGILADVGSEALTSGFRALPDAIENPIRSGAGNVVNYLGNSVAGDAARSAGNAYTNFAQDHPRAARNIEAVTDIGSLLAAKRIAGSQGVNDATSAGAKGAKDLAAKSADFYKQNIVKHAPDVSSETIRNMGGDLFKKATQEGGVIAPEIADAYRSKVLSTLNLDGEAKAYASSPAAERLMKEIPDFIGKPMDFETAKKIDESLGDLAYGTADNFGKLDSTGKKFLDLQHDLRAAMDTLPNTETIQKARKYWSTSLKMRDIERILEKSSSREQPVTAIKNGFSSILNSKKITQYSPEEVKAIQHAAKTGVVTDALKLAGSGLVPIASGVAGSAGGPVGTILGGAIGYAVQQGSKAIGVARQTYRANKAMESVINAAGLPTKKLTANQIKKLPHEKMAFYLRNTPEKLPDVPQNLPSQPLMLMAPNSAREMTPSQLKAAQAILKQGPISMPENGFEMTVKQPVINMTEQSGRYTPLLPAPKAQAMSEAEANLSRAQMERGNPNTVNIAGAAIKPPVSQFANFREKLGRGMKSKFDNNVRLLNDGDVSQNEFVKSMQALGLSPTKARGLAHEVRSYGIDRIDK